MGNRTIRISWGIGVILLSGCNSETVFSKSAIFTSSASSSGTIQVTPTPSSAPSPQASAAPQPVPSPSASPTVASSGGAVTCGSNNPTSAASFYPCSMYFNMPITSQPADPQSATLISALQANGAWGGTSGNPRAFGITGMDNGTGTGIDVYYTNDPATSPVTMDVESDMGGNSDPIPTIPIPSGGSTKGFEDGDTSCTGGGDCHYIVMDVNNQREYDAWESTTNGTTAGSIFSSSYSALWPFNPSGGWYETMRGFGCTSADATGLPIAPLLFSVEELAAGQINHALRFILNNNEIVKMGIVWPGTHATSSASAASGSGMPYGAYLRLNPNYNISSLPCGTQGCGAQIIAKALQTYGMILADGGMVTLTAKSAKYSSYSYTNYFSSNFAQDLAALQPSDFTVVQPPGAPTAMPTGAPAAFVASGQSNASTYTTKISTIASNPSIMSDFTCYRNSEYPYLQNISVSNPPSASASVWTNSESGCSNVTNLSAWLDCQIQKWNN